MDKSRLENHIKKKKFRKNKFLLFIWFQGVYIIENHIYIRVYMDFRYSGYCVNILKNINNIDK